ncbi:MAG TPA: EamA family transporter [Sphingobacteriaceae bacterium]|nr:EamA family transporter [Sphingobacteriaceae bacterium]
MKNSSATAPPILIFLAFAAVYLIWGSTYLGIAIAIKSIPPMIMGGTRFLIAGTLLFLWCHFINKDRSVIKDWRDNGIAGTLMLFGGNGAVAWVEQYLPTGIVAVAVASLPIWLAILDKPNWRVTFSKSTPIIGLLLGFAGVILLFTSGKKITLNDSPLASISIPVLIAGNISWALGTLYSKNIKSSTPIFLRVSIQMLAAGLLYAIVGVISGEWRSFNIHHAETNSLLAIVYLILCGSLIGYVAYIWLLTVRPAAQVGTFAYVNPAVAVLLGWLVLNEKPTIFTLLSLIVILAGVVLINLSYKKTNSNS